MSTFFKTIPRPLNLLVSLALVLLLLKVFVFNKFHEVFNGAHELGLIVEGVLASVLASYIFYLIVIHIKEVNDKKAVYPHILKWANYVVNDCKSQLKALSKETGIDLSLESMTEQNIKRALERTKPYDDAPLLITVGRYANWIHFFENYKSRSRKHISKIMSQLTFLDANLVAKLSKIEDCAHFNHIDILITQRISNSNLASFSKPFFKYCKYCQELESYLESELILEDEG